MLKAVLKKLSALVLAIGVWGSVVTYGRPTLSPCMSRITTRKPSVQTILDEDQPASTLVQITRPTDSVVDDD